MAGADGSLDVGATGEKLETVLVTTGAGANLHREGVVTSDPIDAAARARVRNADPASDDHGQVMRIAGTVPLPAGAATAARQDALHADLATLNADIGTAADTPATDDAGTWSLIALFKRLAAKLPGLGQKTMAQSESVTIASDQANLPIDFWGSVLSLLHRIANPISIDSTTGRVRVLIDASGGAQTLGTVTTVGTVNAVTNVAQIGGIPANTMVADTMHAAWAQACRSRIS